MTIIIRKKKKKVFLRLIDIESKFMFTKGGRG